MRRISAVARKELRQIARDPLSLLLLLGMPAMMLLIYGYAINFDVRHVRLAVEDRDRSAASRDLVASFVNSTYFDLVADLSPGADFERIFQRREAKAILVLPEGYSEDLAAGRPATAQLVLDGSDANTATTALGYASALAEAASARLSGVSAPGGPAAIYEPRVWYNPELRSTQFLVPGLVGFILMITAVLSTALSVVREKERGTMEQLRVTALRPAELILGKTLPYLGISLAASIVILVASRLLFGVVVRGSYGALLIATLVYLFGALGFGVLVSSLARSQAMAFQIGILSAMLPAIFLSGFIFPIRSMPLPLRLLTRVVPARYYLTLLRGVILKGTGLGPYVPELLFLVLFAAVMVSLAYARLARRAA